MHIILLEMLAVAELQQLPLLLQFKLHVHRSFAGAAAAAAVVRNCVPDDAFFCCVSFSHDLCECTPRRCCRMYSLDLLVILYS